VLGAPRNPDALKINVVIYRNPSFAMQVSVQIIFLWREYERSSPKQSSTFRYLDNEAVNNSLDMTALIASVEQMFRSGAVVPPRHGYELGPDGKVGSYLIMPAWDKAMTNLGVKLVTVFPQNASKGLPAVGAQYLLYDGQNGRINAVTEADFLTPRRTAAVSALAAKYLSRADASKLLIVGAGRVASFLPEAYLSIRELHEIRIWDINPAAAEMLAEKVRSMGVAASVERELSAGVAWADIVSCATLATDPLVNGASLRPGAHLDLIGSFTPAMREADDEAVRRSTIFVDTFVALEESGDLVQPIKNGTIHPVDVRGDISSIVSGACSRTSSEEITLFKAVGTASADLAAALLALRSSPN